MSRESRIKRYEPLGFLLAMGMVVMSGVMLFSLYKFERNVSNGVILAPAIDKTQWVGVGILMTGVLLMLWAQLFFKEQKFTAFRGLFSMSFFILLFFLFIQMLNIPLKKAGLSATPKELGFYYYGFITGVYMLFFLLGIVGHGVILYRIYKGISYVDSFIFSVNPPNVLNLKLLVRYMIFVAILWLAIIIFMKSYAA